MSISNGDVVAMHYDLKDEHGNLIESTKNVNPLEFLVGYNNILPKLEEKVVSSSVGDIFSITLDAKDAYGDYKDSYIREVERKNFPDDLHLEVGMDFIADTEEGKMVFFIKEINEDQIFIDFNHPLAGTALTFDVELVATRPATDEEIQHGHVHSGHQHDHDHDHGGCGSGGCGGCEHC